MIDRLYGLAQPILHRLDPERAHELALATLAYLPGTPLDADPRLHRQLLGLDFPNPLGLAAGFDKNGVVADGVLGLGFGFVELGTVTPRPQAGNPRPRLFRLDRSGAIINRLGFNNLGFDAIAQRLEQRRARPGVVGLNIGANRDSTDRIADYSAGVRRFAGKVDYLTINISSPNTPGLRDLQRSDVLAELLDAVVAARGEASTPILLKLAPDLDRPALEAIALVVKAKRVDGVIIGNTTVTRPEVANERRSSEEGGLSGRPLFRLSTIQLARFRQLVGRDMPLIGVGGIDSGAAALDKLAAGADLLQLYSGMIFKGPGLARAILADLSARVVATGAGSVAELVGHDTDRWAAAEI